jgi:hypothetical protein
VGVGVLFMRVVVGVVVAAVGGMDVFVRVVVIV